MVDWDDLRYFLAVQRAGTLARAASQLRINATTVGRRLTALEEQIGARLFDRTPEGYLLTSAGRELLPYAERMESESLALERNVAGADQRLTGTVRLSITEMLATRFLAPHLGRFAERYPEIALDLNCTSRSVSLIRGEADIALRLSRPHEENVVARRLSQVELGLYAASLYLDCHGVPEDAECSLRGHQVLLFADSRAFTIENKWLEARLDGARVVLRSDSVSSVYAAAMAGLGIALMPRIVADVEPVLCRIATRSAPEPRVIWQAVHADLQRSARIQAVLRFLVDVVVPGTMAPPAGD